jgi:hypothetical protein
MTRNIGGFALLVLCLVAPAAAQVSGYFSAGYGYNNNPLYNYERDGDQVAQTYLDLSYTDDTPSRRFKVGYVNGLTLFNHLAERSYLQHDLLLAYMLAPGVADEAPDGEDPPPFSEGAVPALDFGLKLGARHDRSAFEEFDNYGSEVTAKYRLSLWNATVLRLEAMGGYRDYVTLDPLSNLVGSFTAGIGTAPGVGWQYGAGAITALKHYTTSVYDTTVYEQQRTFVWKAAGKGKGGARIRVPSDKKILVNAEVNSTLQLAGTLTGGYEWEGGSAAAGFIYRFNPGAGGRYIAQVTNSAYLNEDIYHDYFAYEGPDLTLRARHIFPAGISAILTVQTVRKMFTAPAYDLNGVVTAEHRTDRRLAADLYVQRYFGLPGGFGTSVAVAVSLLRNESNDMYNDFSVATASLFVGFGF